MKHFSLSLGGGGGEGEGGRGGRLGRGVMADGSLEGKGDKGV